VADGRRHAFPAAGTGRVFIQIDGERAGYLPAEVTIVPDALTLLVSAGIRRLGRKARSPGIPNTMGRAEARPWKY